MAQYNKTYQTIGENITNLRKHLGLKQEAFARELNDFLKKEFGVKDVQYDYKTVSNWEMGKSIPKMEVLIAICKHYNLSLDELLKDKINDFVSKSSFSKSEESILDEFIKNPAVCVNKNGKFESAFNPEMYRYGQLSYLAENLVEFRGEMSKNFSFTNATKYVEVTVGLLDINDGKLEFHTLGTGDNDIVSVENIPCEIELNYDNKSNSVIKTIMYNELLIGGFRQVIKLGNEKTYIFDEIDDFDDNCKFNSNNLPKDLEEYGLTKEDDLGTYTFVRSEGIDDRIFDCYGGNEYYCKKAGIIIATHTGVLKCSDAQLIKVLTDDYKHRLIQTLDKISDDSVYEQYQREIDKYKYGEGTEAEIKKAEELLKQLKASTKEK